VSVPADVLIPLARPGGKALMLGHVHPDADVLGTLLAIDDMLTARGFTVTAGGPHPAPDVLAFLPGVERYRILSAVEGPLDVVVLTDCPNPLRTQGLLEQARATGATIVNIDHHPDNRLYGDVNWIEPAAAATGEMVYRLGVALGARFTPAIATNLFTAIHTDTGSFRYSNTTEETFRIAAALGPRAPSPPSCRGSSTSAGRRTRSAGSVNRCAASRSVRTGASPGSPCPPGPCPSASSRPRSW